MIKRLHRYLHSLRRPAAAKQFHFVRPNKKAAEKVIRQVITKHKEALKELSKR